jgi:hypothetical protein
MYRIPGVDKPKAMKPPNYVNRVRKLEYVKPPRADLIKSLLQWDESDNDLYYGLDVNPRLSVAVIGHSFVARLIDDITQDYQKRSVQEYLGLRGTRLFPSLIGLSGAKVGDLDILFDKALEVNPHMMIVDLGSNDLTHINMPPDKLADDIKAALDRLIPILPRLELTLICNITQKMYMFRNKHYERRWSHCTKQLEEFNRDVERYNIHVVRCTRRDDHLLRWRHKGAFQPLRPCMSDGSHLDTPFGKKKYKHSINDACRWAKDQLLKRRTMTRSARKRLEKKQRMEKRQAYWQMREAQPRDQPREGRHRRAKDLNIPPPKRSAPYTSCRASHTKDRQYRQ